MFITQNEPKVLVGLRSERPNPSGMQVGYQYLTTDTGELFVVKNVSNVLAWAWVGEIPTGLQVYVNATTGIDTNPGTSSAPLRTLQAALDLVSQVQWRGAATIFLQAGTYPLAGLLNVPGSISGEPILLQGAMADSGLGTRTATVGGTVGSGAVFGTIVDQAGGLTVDAWRGYVLRITSGAESGREFLIDSNTADTFTIVGTASGGPYTSGTFVVEKPSVLIESTTGTLDIRSHTGRIVTARHIQFTGANALSSTFRLRGVQLMHSACWFESFGVVLAEYFGAMGTIPAAGAGYITDPGIKQVIGSFFNTNVASAALRANRDGVYDMTRSLINGYQGDLNTTSGTQFVNSSVRRFGVRCNNGSVVAFSGTRIQGVAAIAGSRATGAILVDGGSTVSLANVDVSNTTGANANALAVVQDARVTSMTGVSGSSNPGYGIELRTQSVCSLTSGNAVAGTLGQVKIGTLVTTWAVVQVANATTSDAGTAVPEGCFVSA